MTEFSRSLGKVEDVYKLPGIRDNDLMKVSPPKRTLRWGAAFLVLVLLVIF